MRFVLAQTNPLLRVPWPAVVTSTHSSLNQRSSRAVWQLLAVSLVPAVPHIAAVLQCAQPRRLDPRGAVSTFRPCWHFLCFFSYPPVSPRQAKPVCPCPQPKPDAVNNTHIPCTHGCHCPLLLSPRVSPEYNHAHARLFLANWSNYLNPAPYEIICSFALNDSAFAPRPPPTYITLLLSSLPIRK